MHFCAKLSFILVLLCNTLDIINGQYKTGRLSPEILIRQENAQNQSNFPATVEEVTIPIQITFVVSAKELPNSDRHSSVDPFVKVSTYSSENPEKVEIGRSETLKNNQDPNWSFVFRATVKKGISQKLAFVIQDHDVLDRDDEIGAAEIEIDEFLQKSGTVMKNLNFPQPSNNDSPNNGSILIRETKPFYFKLTGSSLPRHDSFNGMSDPYVKCYFRNNGPNGQSIKFYQTSVINNVEDVEWPDKIEFANYIPGSNQYLHFRVKDDDTFGKDPNMGETILEIDQFVRDNKPKLLVLEGDGINVENSLASITVIPVDLK